MTEKVVELANALVNQGEKHMRAVVALAGILVRHFAESEVDELDPDSHIVASGGLLLKPSATLQIGNCVIAAFGSVYFVSDDVPGTPTLIAEDFHSAMAIVAEKLDDKEEFESIVAQIDFGKSDE